MLTEGIIDHLRTLDGTAVAAVVRDQPERGRAGRKVSLRSTDGRVDVSAIAREQGGGGHQRAAGFGTDLELRRGRRVPARPGRRAALARTRHALTGALLVDKPAGPTSHDVVARVRRERDGVKVGHAGTLDPFATGLLIVLLGRATRLQRFLLDLPKTYVATRPPRLALDHRATPTAS